MGNCRESPEHAFRKKTLFLTLLKYRVYRVIIVSKPKISCNIVWTLKKNIAEGWSGGLGGRSHLPKCAREFGKNEIEACGEICEEDDRQCVFAGDFRVNEQPGLSTMHTLWVREHLAKHHQ